MIDVRIPLPPSVNALYANYRRGRHRTLHYNTWIRAAGWELLLQRPRPVLGRYRMTIELPRIRGDPANRIKAIEDLFVTHGLIQDDSSRFCAGLTVIPTEKRSPFAHVRIEEATV